MLAWLRLPFAVVFAGGVLCQGQVDKPCPDWASVEAKGSLRLSCVDIPAKSRPVRTKYETDLQIRVTDDLDRSIQGAEVSLHYESTKGEAGASGQQIGREPDGLIRWMGMRAGGKSGNFAIVIDARFQEAEARMRIKQENKKGRWLTVTRIVAIAAAGAAAGILASISRSPQVTISSITSSGSVSQPRIQSPNELLRR